MALLNELYDALFEQIRQLNERVEAINAEEEKLRQEVDLTIPEQIQNLKKQRVKVEVYTDRINKIREYAERHLVSKNIQTIAPRPLNFNRLRYWSSLIDADLADDPYAQRVYILCRCNLEFLKNKDAEYEQKLNELCTTDISDAEKRIEELSTQRLDIEKEYKALIDSDEMTSFASAINAAHASWSYDALPEHYKKVEVDAESVAPGAIAYQLPVPIVFSDALKARLGKFYDVIDGSGYVWLPIEFSNGVEQTVLINYSSSVETKFVKKGLQNYLFHIMNDTRTGDHKIYFIDALHYNTSMLGPLKALEDTDVMFRIPRNPEQIDELLSEIVASFSDYDEILGLADSVSDYNVTRTDDEKLARTTLFLLGYPSAADSKIKEKVQRILINHERYGVTVILIDTYSEKKKLEYNGVPEYIVNSADRIVMDQRDFTYQKGEDGNVVGFRWYGLPQSLSDTYVDDINQLVSEKKALGNIYSNRVNLVEVEPYRRGFKDICVPVAIDQRDEVHSISFENENFAHYLMGASGSGKSTLLHNIITGIIRNYHPDDVELWLADFKMSEFAQYMSPIPPHVKYILLDESKELVFDLIDRLTEKMMERQRFFMQNREMKKVENVPVTRYMPIIFVILDEFSIMSQSVAESDIYKRKLQNLLAKGRALGIKFIFSSQTFKGGIGGLTATAKGQIQTRVAMKNSDEEINATLELTSTTKTDQVKNWIEALPPHYILMKYRDGEQMKVKRLQVMYFDGKPEDAMQPQRDLINSINAGLKPIEESEYSGGSSRTYVNKHPVIVDGNAYDKYCGETVAKLAEAYRAEHQKDLLGDETFLAMGTPRLMVKNKLVVLNSETRENLLLIAKSTEQAAATSIMLSCMKAALAQGKKVKIWAYGRNRLFMAYKEQLAGDNIEIVEGIEAICIAIKEMRDLILRREQRDEFIVLIGMDRICSDFELVDTKSSGTQTPVKAAVKTQSSEAVAEMNARREEYRKQQAEQEISPEQAMQNELATVWPEKKAELEKQYEKDGKEPDEIRVLLREAMMEIAQKIKDKFAERLDATADADEDSAEAVKNAEAEESVETSEVTETTKAEETVEASEAGETATVSESETYNALDDFTYLIKQGSRLGTHFLMTLNSFADLKACGVRRDLFRYRMSFATSVEESRSIFDSKIADSLPEHICQFDDTYESYSFRPYLHKGVGWDGWGVDDHGDVIDPMNI